MRCFNNDSKIEHMVKRLLLILACIFGSLLSMAQTTIPSTQKTTAAQRIVGTVTDANTGEPIPFASIYYKGHDMGVTSDIDGLFTIERHEGWTLRFSSVGYVEQYIDISDKTPQTMTVRMTEDTRLLTEWW